MKRQLTDVQWAKIVRHLPKPKPKPKGGRPRADDRECMEGILWVLRSGARWKDMPSELPAYASCWRRLNEWTAADVWLTVWRAFLGELDEAKQLDWSEAFMDGTFAPAKKGALASARHAKVRGQSLWYWQTARVFLSESTFRLPISTKSSSRSRRSKK